VCFETKLTFVCSNQEGIAYVEVDRQCGVYGEVDHCLVSSSTVPQRWS
jgi:hypothetical protein